MSQACAPAEEAGISRPSCVTARDPGRLDALRATIAKITAQAGMNEFLTKSFSNLDFKAEAPQKHQPRVSLGRDSRFDRLLGGGLKLGTLTEILGARPGDAPAAAGFLLALGRPSCRASRTERRLRSSGSLKILPPANRARSMGRASRFMALIRRVSSLSRRRARNRRSGPWKRR